MGFYESNRDVILSRHPHAGPLLREALAVGTGRENARHEGSGRAGAEGADRLRIESSGSGAPTATLDGRYIHSRFDPRQEAQRIAESELHGRSDLYLFYHLGLGYLPEAILAARPGIQVVVVEPDASLLAGALSARDLGSLLSDPNVHLFSDSRPEAIATLLDELAFSRIKVVRLRAMLRENVSYFQMLDGVIGSYGLRKKINLNTLRRFGRLWLKNLTDNIPILLSAPGVNRLQNLFAGIPALVIASGPSLDRVLPHLPELRKRCLVVAVDTSLGACLSRGVEPDFLVVVDPQYWNTRHLDNLCVHRSIMVSESSAHPRVFRSIRAKTILTSSLFPLGQYLESVIGEKGKIGAGGSVATAAWDFARLLGCRPIIMTGLDLGFPGRMTHFRGALFERLFLCHSRRIDPAEGRSFSYLHQADPFRVSSSSGGSVLTDQRMIVYKWWFENQLKIHEGVTTQSLSPDGVRIDGMPVVDPESVLRLSPRRDEIDHVFDRGLELLDQERRSGERASARARLLEAVKGLIDDMRELERLAAQGGQMTETIRESYGMGVPPVDLFEMLDGIDRQILKSTSRYVVSFLLQPIIQRITSGGADAESAEEESRPGSVGVGSGVGSETASGAGSNPALDNSGALYAEIRESSAFHIGLLEKAAKRLTVTG